MVSAPENQIQRIEPNDNEFMSNLLFLTQRNGEGGDGLRWPHSSSYSMHGKAWFEDMNCLGHLLRVSMGGPKVPWSSIFVLKKVHYDPQTFDQYLPIYMLLRLVIGLKSEHFIYEIHHEFTCILSESYAVSLIVRCGVNLNNKADEKWA